VGVISDGDGDDDDDDDDDAVSVVMNKCDPCWVSTTGSVQGKGARENAWRKARWRNSIKQQVQVQAL
jgi:hypothetical protein